MRPTLLATLLAAALLPGRTFAVIGGSTDTTHPSVVLVVNVQGGASACNGVLVAPAAVLTAAHCLAQVGGPVTSPPTAVAPGQVRIYTAASFAPAAQPPVAGVGAALVLHPQWNGGYLHDLAVVQLAAPIHGVTPATLRTTPLAGADLAAPLVLVGYGYTSVAAPSPFVLTRSAVAAPLTEDAFPTSLRIGGPGATACDYDSGAGAFTTGTGQELAALVVDESPSCTGPVVAYDAATMRPFVEASLPAPPPGTGGCTTGGAPGGLALAGLLLALGARRRAALTPSGQRPPVSPT